MSQNFPNGPMGQIPGGPPLQPLGYSSPSQGGLHLKRVAFQQRAVNLCLLVYIASAVVLIMAKGNGMLPVALIAVVVYCASVVTAAVFIFMLAISLYGTASGILLGIGTLVPLVNLVVLLTVNGKATKVLREHGVKVGFLGADPSTVPTDV